MRLVRFRHGDRIATGAIEPGSDEIRVLRGTFFEDPLPTGETVALGDVLLLAPVLPSKLVCVGKNYAAHAAEFGMKVPEEPLLFLKPSTAVIGPGDPIQLLPISRRVDYEGELAVVIGRLARGVRTEDAFKYILGYTCANDVTLRDLQKTDDQWARAKGFDGSAPIGPWIATDLDPNDTIVRTRLNGEIRQQASTSEMVFGVATLIEYITVFMTLLPGDVLLTGRRRVWLARGRRRRRGRGRRRGRVAERGARVTVRCRFAPAPSGSIHVGNARTRAVLVALRPPSRRGLHPPGRGHRRESCDRGGVPRRRRGPPMARPRLGRGPGRRGPTRAVPAVGAAGHLPRDDRAVARGGHAYRCCCTAEELEERRKAALAHGESHPGTTAVVGHAPTRSEPRSKPKEGRSRSGSTCPSGNG